MEKINIKDNSGDRKYFTQIPNMIVNHSTAYEQSLYLVMKRLAGEGGTCYASLNFLSKKMGAHRISVSQTISKLLKRKWIKETDKTKVQGGYVRTFIIVDLWARNLKEYKSASQVATSEVRPKSHEVRQIPTRSASQIDTSKKRNKIYNKSISFNKKPYYNGMPIVDKLVRGQNRRYCIPLDGSSWLEFAGQEKDIEWRPLMENST